MQWRLDDPALPTPPRRPASRNDALRARPLLLDHREVRDNRLVHRPTHPRRPTAAPRRGETRSPHAPVALLRRRAFRLGIGAAGEGEVQEAWERGYCCYAGVWVD